MVLLHVIAFLWRASWAMAKPYDFGNAISILSERQAFDSRTIVSSLPLGKNGSVPLRLEIRQMMANSYSWNLLILALSLFQSLDQGDPLSWYQITGIHGVPFISWEGVEAEPGAEQSGYCTHRSVLFPIWHRVYLALVEQQIFRIAQTIANMFSDPTERDLYQQAASNIRLPYWDWVITPGPGESVLPEAFWNSTMEQNGPNGRQLIQNPLYSYPFHPLDGQAMIWSPFTEWTETKRAPNKSVSLQDPPSMNDEVNTIMLIKLPELQQRVSNLLRYFRDFNSFSTKEWANAMNVTDWDSIEALHDDVHTYSGLAGHMAYVPLSAFDPIFFFHHAMVDRLVSIWQTLNPNAWIVPMAAGETSFNALAGTMQQSSTPLTPFLASSDGTFWNADMARDTLAFGYSYADILSPSIETRDVTPELIKKITSVWAKSDPESLAVSPQDRPLLPQAEKSMSSQDHALMDSLDWRPDLRPTAPDPSRSAVVHGNEYTAWEARASITNIAVNGTYIVYLFIGQIPREAKNIWDWERVPNRAGSVVLSSKLRDSADRNQTHALCLKSSTPLTPAMVKLVGANVIADLTLQQVLPLLREELHFRIVDVFSGVTIDPGTIEGLYLGIASAQTSIRASENNLGDRGPWTPRLDLWATSGKAEAML